MNLSRRITTLLVVAVAAVLAALAGSTGRSAAAEPQAASGQAQARTLRIWADADRTPAVTRVGNQWASRRGVTVQVVTKEFDKIRDDLKTVKAEDAPDVIVAAHDWTGQLAADGLVLALRPRKATLTQMPKYALDAFSYGRSVSNLYGAPVALENIGLVTNTRLARVPKTFAELERRALAFQRGGSNRIGLAVQQGGGDAYHMYPFFSGLCGYVFGRTRGGALNPNNIGVANPRFLRNAPMIDRWNRQGLIRASLDADASREAFLSGRAAYWITGPWFADTIKARGIPFQVTQLPKIKCRSVPFLGVQGYMVTRFARTHGVEAAAKDLVGSYMMTPAAQLALAAANKRFPANTVAGRRVSDPVLKQFGRAGVGGVPMPNIPQMASVWGDLGSAWVNSTKGDGATNARSAFTVASRNIAAKLRGG